SLYAVVLCPHIPLCSLFTDSQPPAIYPLSLHDALPISINAALSATSGAGGGTVFFPPGTYVCTGTLNAGGTVGVILQGAGGRSGGAATATLLRYTPSAGARFIDGRASAGLCIPDASSRA